MKALASGYILIRDFILIVAKLSNLQDKLTASRYSRNRSEAVEFIDKITGVKLPVDAFYGYEESQEITQKARDNGVLINPNAAPSIDKLVFATKVREFMNAISCKHYLIETSDVESGYAKISNENLCDILASLSDYHERENFTFNILNADISTALYVDYYYDMATDSNEHYELAIANSSGSLNR